MNDKKYLNKTLEELSIKEALTVDVSEIIVRSSLIIDPAPLPHIPITQAVLGLKILNGAKKLIQLGIS